MDCKFNTDLGQVTVNDDVIGKNGVARERIARERGVVGIPRAGGGRAADGKRRVERSVNRAVVRQFESALGIIVVAARAAEITAIVVIAGDSRTARARDRAFIRPRRR